MARPLRIEFAGALYHATARGDRRESIFEDATDRDQAMRAAWRTGEYSYAQIAEYFGVHFSTVGRAVRRKG